MTFCQSHAAAELCAFAAVKMSQRSFGRTQAAVKVFKWESGSQGTRRPLWVWIAEVGQSTGHKGFEENVRETHLRNIAHTALLSSSALQFLEKN